MQPTTEIVLELQGISKSYGNIQALNDVSFSVPRGSVFGILGPNGSGKTTMLGIITDILKSDKGTFKLLGHDPAVVGQSAMADVRKQIGTLLETPNFYHYLSAERNLRIAAEIKGLGLENIDAVLQKVNLYERRHSKFSTFSLGMKQRLAIASALLADPHAMIFDEPTNGLDPVGILEIRELIIRLAKEGKTIIMASHMLDEVEKVCSHVAIMKKGTLIAAGHVDEVLVNDDIVEVSAADISLLENVLNSFNGYSSMKTIGNTIQLLYPTGTANLEKINAHCFQKGVVLNLLQTKKKSLETKFFELTNQ
jgi:ABC-type multidrug transport system ATPase subunit